MTCELLMGIWDPSDTGYVTREESAATVETYDFGSRNDTEKPV